MTKKIPDYMKHPKITKGRIMHLHTDTTSENTKKPFTVVKASVEELNKPLYPHVKTVVTVQKLRYIMSKACSEHHLIYKESSAQSEIVQNRVIRIWLKKFKNVLGYDDPVEFMEFIIKNWQNICSGMRGAGHTMSFLNNSFVFDTLNFFERPSYRNAIIDFIDTCHYMSSKQKYFEGKHKKMQEVTFGPQKEPEPEISEDALQRMRDRFSEGYK